LVPVQCL